MVRSREGFDFSRAKDQQEFENLSPKERENLVEKAYSEALEEHRRRIEDEEFIKSVREKKKIPNPNYRIVTFEKGERGFFTRDLGKFGFPVTRGLKIEEGIPYVVMIEKDTVPGEKRGSLQLKIEHLATNRDFFELTDPHIGQIKFYQSRQDESVIGRHDRKVVLVDRSSRIKPKADEEWLGSLTDKERFYIFRPLQKVSQYVIYNLHAGRSGMPWIEISAMEGLNKKRGESLIFENPTDLERLPADLPSEDRATFTRLWEIYWGEESKRIEERREFEEDLARAKKEAWKIYFENKAEITEKRETHGGYEEKEASSLTGGEAQGIFGAWLNSGKDYQSCIPLEVANVLFSDRRLIEDLRNFEGINLNLKQIIEARPESETLPIENSFYGAKNYEALVYFRKNAQPKIIEISDENFTGELVFEPSLEVDSDIWDEDWGRHKDDSTGRTTYHTHYLLKEAVIDLIPEQFEKIPLHIQERIREIIKPILEKLKGPNWRSEMIYHFAGWIPSYEEILSKAKKLSLEEKQSIWEKSGVSLVKGVLSYWEKLREKKIKQPDKLAEVLWERVVMAPLDLEELREKLPVPNYGTVTSEGEIEWFGLPVKRMPRTGVTKVFRGGQALYGEIIGVSDYKIIYPSRFQLAAWLDEHQAYFEELIKKKEKEGLPEARIRELNITAEEQIHKMAEDSGCHQPDRFGGWIYEIEGNELDLRIELTPDYSRLKIFVTNINSGMGEIDNPEAIISLIREKDFILSDSAESLLRKKVGEEGLKDVRIQGKNKGEEKEEDLTRRLPFREY